MLKGALTIAGVSSLVSGGRGGELALSDYNLNYIPAQSTFDVCSAGNFYVDGSASPKPAAWSDIPRSISFFTALTSGPTPLSSCIYTNPAAPSNGDGGTVSCKGTNFPCAIQTESVLGCNPDAIAGYDTKIKLLIHCNVYVPTTTVETDTSVVVQTITTTIQ